MPDKSVGAVAPSSDKPQENTLPSLHITDFAFFVENTDLTLLISVGIFAP